MYVSLFSTIFPIFDPKVVFCHAEAGPSESNLRGQMPRITGA